MKPPPSWVPRAFMFLGGVQFGAALGRLADGGSIGDSAMDFVVLVLAVYIATLARGWRQAATTTPAPSPDST
jgi:hypothetical protein